MASVASGIKTMLADRNPHLKEQGMVNSYAQTPTDDRGNNINVFVRVRPLTKDEKARGEKSCVQVLKDERFIKVVDYGYGYNALTRKFQFDGCLGPEVRQEQVMEKCQLQRLLDSVLEGYSSAVMACGQTGSGKTYTMCGRNEGRNGDDDQGDGLIAYTVTYLYEAIRKQSSMKGRKVFTLKASYYEVYNEQVNDLLRLDCAPREVKWNVKEGFYVDNLLLVDCESIEDVFSVLNEGAKNRKVGSHELNKDSSRSHCIMTLHVESTIDMAEGPPVVRYGKMLFVDLAGSERLKKSRSSGDMLKETGNINRSLFTLGKVISALAEGKKGDLVPYRESMLTKLLMESLGGNSLALMIACISPASSAVDETLSTLYYATCTKTIVNVPSINIDERDKVIVGLRKEIDMLKEENKLLRSRLGIPAEGELDQSTVSSQRNSDGHGGSALPLSLTNFPNSIGSIGGEKSKVLVSGLSNTQSGWMLDKERMLTQLRTAERLLSKKMPLKSPTDIQETFQERNLHQGERAAIIEGIENIPNRTYSFSSMHPKQTDSDDLFKEKSVDCNSGSRGRSEETGRQKNQISMTGKSNGLVGMYRGSDSSKRKILQPFSRRNRISVDHLSPRIKTKVFPRALPGKGGIKDNGFQGSITVNENAFLRLLDIDVSEEDTGLVSF